MDGIKLKIISDGNPFNTKVINVATGEEIKGVTGIDIHIDMGCARATIEIIDFETNLNLESEINTYFSST